MDRSAVSINTTIGSSAILMKDINCSRTQQDKQPRSYQHAISNIYNIN